MIRVKRKLVVYLLIISQVAVSGICPKLDKIIAYGERFDLKKKQTDRETDIIEWTTFWRNGKTSQKELRRAKALTYLSNAIVVDRPYVIVEELLPVFRNVYENYYVLIKNKKLVKSLNQLLKQEGADKNKIQLQLEKLEKENIRARKEISKYLEEYSAMSSYLEKVAQSDGEAAVSARLVLEKLQARFLIKNLLEGKETVENPGLDDLYREINETHESRVATLKRERRDEFVNWALTISPSQVFLDEVEKLISKVPYFDKPRLHKVFSALSSQRDRKIYSSDIARIAMMHGDVERQLQTLEQINSGTDDGFLKTFARGIESRHIWNKLKKAASEREDKALFQKMEKADAERAGDMSLVRNSGRDQLIHLALNAGLSSLFAYGGLWAVSSDDDEKKNDEEVDKLIEFLEKDPKGKELVEKYRKEPK